MCKKVTAVVIAAAGAYAFALKTGARLFEAHRAMLVRAYGALGRWSAAAGIPVAEVMLSAIVIGVACALIGALAACAIRRALRPLRRWLAGTMALMLITGVILGFMWPVWADYSPEVQAAYERAYSLGELEELILALDGVLRGASAGVDLSGPTMRLSSSKAELAERAAQAYRRAGYQANAPRISRMSALMTRLRIAGIFIPLTGEAIVSPNDFDSALPFTMLHELAHAQGKLHEDEANLLALEVALSSQDAEFIWSGALTALRYALNTLRELDETRYARIREAISGAALRELEAQRAFEHGPRGYDVALSAVSSGIVQPALAQDSEAFVRIAGQGAYDGLTYLLMNAGLPARPSER